MNSIRTYRNLLENLIFAHFVLIKSYEQLGLRKELIFAPFVEQFKTATLRKSYW